MEVAFHQFIFIAGKIASTEETYKSCMQVMSFCIALNDIQMHSVMMIALNNNIPRSSSLHSTPGPGESDFGQPTSPGTGRSPQVQPQEVEENERIFSVGRCVGTRPVIDPQPGEPGRFGLRRGKRLDRQRERGGSSVSELRSSGKQGSLRGRNCGEVKEFRFYREP